MNVTLQMNFDLHLSWGHESVVSLPSTLAGPNYARPLNIFQVLCSSNLCIRGQGVGGHVHGTQLKFLEILEFSPRTDG